MITHNYLAMDWLNGNSEYSSLNEEEKAELSAHFDDAASLEQVKTLLRESEKIMPQEAPREVFTRLDELFDQTYPKPKPISRAKNYLWRYSLLAAAAVVLCVLVIYPWLNRNPSAVNVPQQAKKEASISPKKKQVVAPEKSNQVEQEPIIARLEEADDQRITENINEEAPVALMDEEISGSEDQAMQTYAEDAPTSTMAQLEGYKASNNSLLDEKSELSKTMKESIKDKSKDQDDRQIAEVVMLKKHSKARARKIDTGSMLKNIKPVF